MSRIDERLEAMGIDTSGMTDEQKFQAATGLTFYDETLAANDWYVPGGAANIKKENNGGGDDDQKPQYYTAETAAAYNATLTGAVHEGDVKEEAIEAVSGEHYTQEEIEEAQEGDDAYGKTVDDWKVEPVEGKEAVLWTKEEADEYNAGLTGAVKEGDEIKSEIDIISGN